METVLKNFFKKYNFLLCDGNSVGLDFFAIKGQKNPYKVTSWIEKCICGFFMTSLDNKIDIQKDLYETGMYNKMSELYSNYNLFNVGVVIIFPNTASVKFLSFDRLEEFVKHSVNFIKEEFIFDLDFYARPTTHRHYCVETSRGDITVKSDFVNDFIIEEQNKYKNAKGG